MNKGSIANTLADAGDWSWRSNRYAWWVVVVLTLSMTLSMVDRMIIALMVEPIKADFAITDTHIGLLHGLAFTLLYVVMGLPLGWLVDRRSRKAIAAISLFAWSVMTGLCGVAGSYLQLFLARVGVGIGEAGMSPAAASLISDYFPATKRAAPLLCLTLGTALGGGVALIFGGLVMHLIGGMPIVEVPLFGATRSWQLVFLLLGGLGIVYSVVFVTVREPPRQERLASHALTFRETTAYLASRRPILLYHFLGVGGASLVLMAMNLWIPSFLIRTLGWDRVTVGWGYGTLLASSSVVGVVIAGVVTSRLQRSGRRDAALRVSFWAVIAATLPLLIAPLLRSPQLVLPLLFVGLVSLTMPAALGPVFLQSVCVNEVRGQVIAAYLLVVAVIGNICGPVAVAFITDYIVGDESKIYVSLSVVVLIFMPLAAIALRRAETNHVRAHQAAPGVELSGALEQTT